MRKVVGLAMLGLVAVGAAVVSLVDIEGLRTAATRPTETVRIYFGGEKAAFLRNERVRARLERAHALRIDGVRAGSIEMATRLDVTGMDCIWPSNAVAVEFARDAGRPLRRVETIFNSPIVIYAWAPVAEALAARGVAAERDGFMRLDLAALVGVIREGARWREDLGLPVYGAVKIASTDPTRSNSGAIWSAMLATALNDGAVPSAADVARLEAAVAGYFAAQGWMETSSGDIFEAFLQQGMGARPAIVGYENQAVEFRIANADAAALIDAQIVTLYPEPTVYASHPLASLTERCDRLVEALLDPEIQAFAWADHGFRSGLFGVENDPAALTAARLPASVDFVQPMPGLAAMTRLQAALGATR